MSPALAFESSLAIVEMAFHFATDRQRAPHHDARFPEEKPTY
jgi:hypothetical protein